MQSSRFSVLRSVKLFSTGNVLARKTTLEVTRVNLANKNMARLSIFISVRKFPWKWKLCLIAETEDLLQGPCMDHRQSPNQQLAIHCHTALHIIMMVWTVTPPPKKWFCPLCGWATLILLWWWAAEDICVIHPMIWCEIAVGRYLHQIWHELLHNYNECA